MTSPEVDLTAHPEAERRTDAVWEPCENNSNFDDARMELLCFYAAEVRRERLVDSIRAELDIVPGSAVEARLLDIARQLAGIDQ